jgi:hypothetical protein
MPVPRLTPRAIPASNHAAPMHTKVCPLSLSLSVYAEDDGVVATGVTAVHTLCHCSSCVYFSVSQGCGSSEDDKVTCFCAQHGHLFGS